jgi:hypothetical protein
MYKIEMRTPFFGWDPYGYDDEDQPLRYRTLEEARLDIYETYLSCLESIEDGRMTDTQPLSDFRIVLLDIAGNPVVIFSLTDTGTIATATPC